MKPMVRSWPVSLVVVTLVAVTLAVSARATPPDDERERERERVHPYPAAPAKMYDFAEGLYVTPGGAQDALFFRDRVKAGEIPHPNVFTPEGLFSEHHLPVKDAGGCRQLLCLAGEGTDASLIVQPEVRWLAQVGFGTGLSEKTWQRDALDLVAVVDKSGSMSGQPLALVKESLLQVVSQLRDDDRLAIVLYGDRSHVHLAPTSAREDAKLVAAIQAIESAGSTAMEEGLKVGYGVARQARRGGKSTTRVMLFTDERPNVGATEAGSFMAMAEAASRDGIGLTTIGVGVQFGAELATKIASVRGGNLFFFPDAAKMTATFTDELDTMVSELAYDMELTIAPADGLKIAGVYGLPGQMLQWGDNGSITLHIATLFLSKKAGGIYVALASAGGDALPAPALKAGTDLGWGRVTYTLRGGASETSELSFRLVPRAQASVGLTRGALLVDEATALKAATAAHHEKNDQERAYQLVHALASLFRQNGDAELANERELLGTLEATLARLSGHQGEPAPVAPPRAPVDPVSGLPR